MPVIPIVAAGIAWAGASGAVGALIAGTTFTVGMGLEVVAAVGATLGAVGAVTHDKGLMTAGMVLGGIGGIGSLAVSAGIFGEGAGAATLFGASSAETAAFDNPALGASAMAGGTAAAADTTPSIIDSIGGVTTAAAALPDVSGGASSAGAIGGAGADQLTAPSLTSPTTLSTQAAPSPIDSTTFGATQTAPPAPGVSIPGAPDTPFAQYPMPGATDAPPIPATDTPAVDAPASASPGILTRFGNWIADDKTGMAKYGIIQAAGSLAKGLFDPTISPTIDKLKAETAQTQAQTGITNTQGANIKAPLPVASFKPGIINSGLNQ